MAAQGDINEDRIGNNQGIVGSWAIKIVPSQPSKVPSVNQTARVFRVDFFYKKMFFFFVT